MRILIQIFLAVFLTSSFASAQVRKVIVRNDDILTVRAALGIATIIQLPETIQSAIIGDQSGFKVEYIDRAVTIKPLRPGVKTNLYLVTEKRRYNIRLVTLAQNLADYIVYIKNPNQMPVPTKWVRIRKSFEADGYRLSIVRIGTSEDGFILIDAVFSTSSDETVRVRPDEVWIKQEGGSKVINGLFLSDLKLSKKRPILIGISLAKSDLVAKKSVALELRSERTLSLSLTEDLLWK